MTKINLDESHDFDSNRYLLATELTDLMTKLFDINELSDMIPYFQTGGANTPINGTQQPINKKDEEAINSFIEEVKNKSTNIVNEAIKKKIIKDPNNITEKDINECVSKENINQIELDLDRISLGQLNETLKTIIKNNLCKFSILFNNEKWTEKRGNKVYVQNYGRIYGYLFKTFKNIENEDTIHTIILNILIAIVIKENFLGSAVENIKKYENQLLIENNGKVNPIIISHYITEFWMMIGGNNMQDVDNNTIGEWLSVLYLFLTKPKDTFEKFIKDVYSKSFPVDITDNKNVDWKSSYNYPYSNTTLVYTFLNNTDLHKLNHEDIKKLLNKNKSKNTFEMIEYIKVILTKGLCNIFQNENKYHNISTGSEKKAYRCVNTNITKYDISTIIKTAEKKGIKLDKDNFCGKYVILLFNYSDADYLNKIKQELQKERQIRGTKLPDIIQNPCHEGVGPYIINTNFGPSGRDYFYNKDTNGPYIFNKEYIDFEKAILIYGLFLCEVLKLHRKGYAHLDLKPENFCVLEKGNKIKVNLIDFDDTQGPVSYTKFNTRKFRGIMQGTPGYNSYEQFNRKIARIDENIGNITNHMKQNNYDYTDRDGRRFFHFNIKTLQKMDVFACKYIFVDLFRNYLNDDTKNVLNEFFEIFSKNGESSLEKDIEYFKLSIEKEIDPKKLDTLHETNLEIILDEVETLLPEDKKQILKDNRPTCKNLATNCPGYGWGIGGRGVLCCDNKCIEQPYGKEAKGPFHRKTANNCERAKKFKEQINSKKITSVVSPVPAPKPAAAPKKENIEKDMLKEIHSNIQQRPYSQMYKKKLEPYPPPKPGDHKEDYEFEIRAKHPEPYKEMPNNQVPFRYTSYKTTKPKVEEPKIYKEGILEELNYIKYLIKNDELKEQDIDKILIMMKELKKTGNPSKKELDLIRVIIDMAANYSIKKKVETSTVFDFGGLLDTSSIALSEENVMVGKAEADEIENYRLNKLAEFQRSYIGESLLNEENEELLNEIKSLKDKINELESQQQVQPQPYVQPQPQPDVQPQVQPDVQPQEYNEQLNMPKDQPNIENNNIAAVNNQNTENIGLEKIETEPQKRLKKFFSMIKNKYEIVVTESDIKQKLKEVEKFTEEQYKEYKKSLVEALKRSPEYYKVEDYKKKRGKLENLYNAYGSSKYINLLTELKDQSISYIEEQLLKLIKTELDNEAEKIINTYASKYKDSRSERNAIISKKREIRDKIDKYKDINDDSKDVGKAYVYYFPTTNRKSFKEQLEEAL